MAWVAAKILHRDISEGNIIIVIVEGQVEGKLIDWENARKIQDLNKGATSPVRSVCMQSVYSPHIVLIILAISAFRALGYFYQD